MKRDAIDFANEKVSVLFRKLLLPTLLGTISISAVTAIDGIFVGHGTGADGVAAINFIVPVYQIISGIGLMIGVGSSVVASIHLSRGNVRVAQINISQAMAIISLLVLLLCIIAFISPSNVARLLGASVTLMPQVVDYLLWITPSYIFMMWSIIGLFIIRLDGSPRYAMWCNIVPALLNVVFDWLFIFPMGMGVKGAAMATSICHVAGGSMALYYLTCKAEKLSLVPLKLSSKSIRLAIRNISYQCRVGSSSLLGELTMAVLIFVGNLTFMRYLGDVGVGAFGIACYYAPFFFMVGNAIAQSAQPIISYNYGISRWTEIKKARKLLLTTSVAIGACVAMLFVCIPELLVMLFVDVNNDAGKIAVNGFPYFASGIVFFILNVAVIGYCQSIERVWKASLFVLLRGFLLLIPSFIFLPVLLGNKGIWLAMPVAEFLTTIWILISFSYSKGHRKR